MANVNPPPHIKLPKKLAADKELEPYFRNRDFIQFQLWQRTGGGNDAVAEASQFNPSVQAQLADLQQRVGSGDPLTWDETGFSWDSTKLSFDQTEA